MKPLFLLLFVTLLTFNSNAQGITDALRYSLEDINGTARYSSMSGAFGALGGDLSAINVNPAGGAVFLDSSSSISMSVESLDNTTNYFETQVSEKHSDFNLNQAGVVFVFYNNEESLFRKFTLGLNYQIAKNYENQFLTSGQSNRTVDQYFLGYAQGIPIDLLQTLPGESVSDLYRFLGENYGYGHQQALLGYQGFIFDPVDADDPNNNQYVSGMAPGAYQQDHVYNGGGFNGKYNINVATQIGEDWYAGINFNSYLIEYLETTQFLETTSSNATGVNHVFFENSLSVLGSGFSMQFGVIHKVNNNLRAGLTYDTPAWLRISEESSQYLKTRRNEDGQQIEQVVNPRIINVYEDYKIQTPGKVTASLAYLFGKAGLLSVDYSYRDFSNLKFNSDNSVHFNNVNQEISNSLQAVSSLRVGGEYRYRQFSFRGGTRFESSPYKDKEMMDDLLGFSLGLGYSFGNTRLDLAYIYTQQEQNHRLLGGDFTNAAALKTVNNTVALTLGFSL